MPFTSREYRSALGRFATGVTVVTTADGKGGQWGVTVNSFTSVSLDPPLISFALGTASENTQAFVNASHYTVNILSEAQLDLCEHFARSGQKSWDGVDAITGHNGCPELPHTLGTIECEHHALLEGGDHLIFLGKVTKLKMASKEAPLLFYKGTYFSLGDAL